MTSRNAIDLEEKEEKISDFFQKRISISSSSETETKNGIRETGDIEDLIYQKKQKMSHYETLNISGIPIKYPFKPYPSQIQFMDKLIRALNGRQHALLESPTGTGKTMALLCGAMAWLANYSNAMKERNKKIEEQRKKEDVKSEDSVPFTDSEEEPPGGGEEFVIPRIYYASRTHKQLAQVIKEFRRTAYHSSFTVLASRTHYCINKKIREKKTDLTEACLEAVKTSDSNHRCHYFNQVEKINKVMSTTNRSVEELVDFGKKNTVCPYFLARASSKVSQVIFCPFDYLVSPGIRDAMDISLESSIIIVDEAHNIEDVCRDSGSFEVADSMLYGIQNELMSFFDKQANHEYKLLLPEAHRSQLNLVNLVLDWLSSQHVSVNSKISFDRTVYEYKDHLYNNL